MKKKIVQKNVLNILRCNIDIELRVKVIRQTVSVCVFHSAGSVIIAISLALHSVTHRNTLRTAGGSPFPHQAAHCGRTDRVR